LGHDCEAGALWDITVKLRLLSNDFYEDHDGHAGHAGSHNGSNSGPNLVECGFFEQF
jgi:hypothetical protein